MTACIIKIPVEGQFVIYSLNSPKNLRNYDSIGNKAKGQIKLLSLGYNAPSSIFLDYTFYDYFKIHGDIYPDILEKLLDEELSSTLAVRSSSNIEDTRNQSFAGLLRTVLNVPKDPQALRNAIIECYQAVSKSHFLDYLIKKSLLVNRVKLGLMIQDMVEAKFSGILFTCAPNNPLDTINKNNFHVEYCTGAGDQITSSNLTGNSITVSKETGKIIYQRESVLISKNILESLTEIVRKLEKQMGFPQDIEFVIPPQEDKVYLLQSRPVTAFNYTPEFIIQKENKRLQQIFNFCKDKYHLSSVLSSTNISELFPTPTPLAYSIFKMIFAGRDSKDGAINLGRSFMGYAKINKMEREGLFVSIGNQARVNLFIDSLTFRIKGIPQKEYLKKAVVKYMSILRDDASKANYPESNLYLQSDRKCAWIELYGENGPLYYEKYISFLDNLQKQHIPEIKKKIEEILKKNDIYYRKELKEILLESKIHSTKTLVELKLKLFHYVEYLRKELGKHYVIVSRIAFLITFLVKDKLNYLFEEYQEELFSPMPEHNLLDKYFSLLMMKEECDVKYKMPNQYEYERKVKNNEISLEEFLKVFGHAGSLDIREPRLAELDRIFLENLFSQKQFNKHETKGLEDDFSLINIFYKNLKQLNPIESDTLKKYVEQANLFMTLRETMKFELLKILYLIKIIVTTIGLKTGLKDLIHFLSLDELLFKKNSPKIRFKAISEKAYFNSCDLVSVGKVLEENQEDNLVSKKDIRTHDDKMYQIAHGETIHYGKAEGICLTAKSTTEFYKKLLEYRKQGITNIIGLFKGVELSYFNLTELAGIITENGGQLAHAATIARENNIPYISNVEIDKFQDGSYLIMDTTNHSIIYRQNIK